MGVHVPEQLVEYGGGDGGALIGMSMEKIDKNADILTILDGYKTYAAEYEERKKREEEEEKKRKGEEGIKILEVAKKKSIQEEIAETLRKIKEQEAADAAILEEKKKSILST